MNSQREVVYTKRRSALTGERIDVDVLNMMTDYCEMFADSNRHLTYELFCDELMRALSIVPDFDEASYERFNKAQLAEELQRSVNDVMWRWFGVNYQTWPVSCV